MQISAWLNNSIDPIDGNNKKGEVYWKNVAADYNKNSPLNRRRLAKHCKDHWGKANKKVVCFNGIWCRLKEVYVSGQSDDQLMDKAHEMYKKETKQCFTLVYWWREVRNQPRWTRNYEEAKTKENESVERQIAKETRPLGTKAAKANKKGKDVEDYPFGSISHDDIQLYYDTQALRASTANKMADVQLRLSKEKLEAAHAKERTAMAKNYKELLMADTTCFTEFQRMEHERAVKYFSDKLFGTSNTN